LFYKGAEHRRLELGDTVRTARFLLLYGDVFLSINNTGSVDR